MVGTGRSRAAIYAFKQRNNFVDIFAFDEFRYPLRVARATADKSDARKRVVVFNVEFYVMRASAARCVYVHIFL